MTSGGAAFEWDRAKAASNLVSHGVSFEQVVDFDFASAMFEDDLRWHYGETRTIAYGPIHGRLHVRVHTRRGTHIRVIPLRKANDGEVRRYVRFVEQQSHDG